MIAKSITGIIVINLIADHDEILAVTNM